MSTIFPNTTPAPIRSYKTIRAWNGSLAPLVCFATVLLALLFAITGCGGGSAQIATATGISSQVSIAWAATADHSQWPSNTRSAIITFRPPTGLGIYSSKTVTRPIGTVATTVSYALNLKQGPGLLVVDFYSDINGSGSVVATAAASVTVDQSGVKSNQFGQPLQTIQTSAELPQISISPGLIVPLGLQTRLFLECYDLIDQNWCAIPSNAVWTSTDSTPILTVTARGIATGDLIGTANVQVDLPNQRISQQIRVSAAPSSNYIQLDQPLGHMLFNATDGMFYGTPLSGGLVQSYDPTTGALTRSFAGVRDGPLCLSSDGGTLFAIDGTFNGFDSIRLPSLQPILETNTISRIASLASVPGNSNSVLAIVHSDLSPQSSVAAIFDNGTQRPNTIQLDNGIYGAAIFDPSSNALYMTTPFGELGKYIVDASGIRPPTQFSPIIVGSPLQLTRGTLFTLEGDEISVATGQVIGQLPGVTTQTKPIAMSADGTTVYLADGPTFGSTPKFGTIYVGSVRNRKLLGSFKVPLAGASYVQCAAAIGSNSLALTFQTNQIFLSNTTIIVKNTLQNLTPYP